MRAWVVDFVRKLQWRSIPHFSSSALPCRFGFQPSARWPPAGLVPDKVKRLSRKILSMLPAFVSGPHRCFAAGNLTTAVTLFLERVRSDPTITIRPADKGGRWVILDTSLYLEDCRKQLSVESFYRRIASPLASSPRVSRILLSLRARGAINRKELAYLLPPSNPKPRRFYTLPKIHKRHPQNAAPPGRPIVSDVGSSTYHVGRMLDFFLGPLARRLPSHLTDSFELIAKLSTASLTTTTIFCTLDVRSLYTNIPITEGIERVRRAFQRFPEADRPDRELLELLHVSLTENDFSFGGQRFLQTSGVAMGKAFGGAFANIYMGEWEFEAVRSASLQPTTWYRYQDDVFFLWDHPADSLQPFVDHLNSRDHNIQVDLHADPHSVPFLDLELFREGTEIGYRVYFKPTDSHLLLPASSHHPPHTHRAVLFAQILRWATHCKTRADFSRACSIVFPLWKSQGATRSAIRNARTHVLQLTGQVTVWTPGFFSCGSPRCSLCPHADERTCFEAGDRTFPILYRLSCDSVGCVYALFCSRCHLFYIGQTGNPLRQRLSEHLRTLRSPDSSTALSFHFQGSCSISHLRAFAIERCLDQDKRLAREARWIERFNSVFPRGLNACSSNAAQPINLVTVRADCTARLNSAIRRACAAVVQEKIRYSYVTDKNLRSRLL